MPLRPMNLQSFLAKNLVLKSGISAGFIPNTLALMYKDGVRRVIFEEAFELARAIGGAE